jgi:hypothetical protein
MIALHAKCMLALKADGRRDILSKCPFHRDAERAITRI